VARRRRVQRVVARWDRGVGGRARTAAAEQVVRVGSGVPGLRPLSGRVALLGEHVLVVVEPLHARLQVREQRVSVPVVVVPETYFVCWQVPHGAHALHDLADQISAV